MAQIAAVGVGQPDVDATATAPFAGPSHSGGGGVTFAGNGSILAVLRTTSATFRPSASSRGRDLGLLRARGATRRDLLMVAAAESLIIGLVAGLLGAVLALGAVSTIITAASGSRSDGPR